MAEITLKKKITLRKKQEECAFTFSGKLKVKLFGVQQQIWTCACSLRKRTVLLVVCSRMNIVARRAT